MQWLKWFINTGEGLLKIIHPVLKLYTTWVRDGPSVAEAQLPAIFMHFGLKLLYRIQCNINQSTYTVNFSEGLSDLVIIMQLIKENFTHPMSLLILVVACECVIALFAWQYK